MLERDIIAEINMALARMRQRGHGSTVSYEQLCMKRDAAADLPYKIVSVSEDLIGGVASKIVEINRSTRNQRILHH